MNMPRFTVTHPVFTSMVMLIMVILGGFTLMRTSIDLMPELSLRRSPSSRPMKMPVPKKSKS